MSIVIPLHIVARRLAALGKVGLLAALTLLTVTSGQARPAVVITGQTPGNQPFISLLSVAVDNATNLDYITFLIDSKPGSVVRPVSARYSAAYLRGRGYIDLQTKVVAVPVFGLYANYENTVTLTTGFLSGVSEVHRATIQTADYPDDFHRQPTVVQARTQDTSLSYDFFLLKDGTSQTTPLIIDTDGEIRWAGFAGVDGVTSTFYNNGLYVSSGRLLLRAELDGGGSILGDYTDQDVVGFHYNLDFGRDGILAEVDTRAQTEAVALEVDPITGAVLRTWDFARIIGAAMAAGGDDPALFVQSAPTDWFHQNAATYRPSDNTIVVSSRENFVIALDYDTQEIRWILGDSTKRWYTFPSLRKYALALAPDSHVPIGQHSVSIFRDRLLLFDNGFGSLNQRPAGESRTYSAARKYVINTADNTARESWNYAADETIFSAVCSSVYEDQPKNFLIDYASEGFSLQTPAQFTEIVGLNRAREKVFDYQYPAVNVCASGWNAQPVHLENLVFN